MVVHTAAYLISNASGTGQLRQGTGIIIMQSSRYLPTRGWYCGCDGIAALLVRFAARRVREGENLPDKLPAQ